MEFGEIEQRLPAKQPGIYEIHTRSGIALKVGISHDLRDRLLAHRESRQSALKLKPGGTWSNPDDVESKKSILAKHLYFDSTISPAHDLTCQSGRRAFLSECCYIVVESSASKDDVREIENRREASSGFRYVGHVLIR